MKIKIGIGVFLLFCLQSNAQVWTDADKLSFYTSCKNNAVISMQDSAASHYCACFRDKFFIASPNPFVSVPDSTLSKMALDCQRETKYTFGDSTFRTEWTIDAKQAFLVSCEKILEGTSYNGKTYCSCVLQKIMVKYPDPQFVLTIPTEVMEAITGECLGN